jgi:hypothetical protein
MLSSSIWMTSSINSSVVFERVKKNDKTMRSHGQRELLFFFNKALLIILWLYFLFYVKLLLWFNITLLC